MEQEGPSGGVGRGQLGTVCALRHFIAPARDGIFGRRLPVLPDKRQNFHFKSQGISGTYSICDMRRKCIY